MPYVPTAFVAKAVSFLAILSGWFTLIWPSKLVTESEVARLTHGAEMIHSGQLRASHAIGAATKRQLGLLAPEAPKEVAEPTDSEEDDPKDAAATAPTVMKKKAAVPAVAPKELSAVPAAAAAASASVAAANTTPSPRQRRAEAAATVLGSASSRLISRIESDRDIESALAAIDNLDRKSATALFFSAFRCVSTVPNACFSLPFVR